MANIKAAQAGNWSSGSTWVNGVVPVAGDSVWMNGFNVILDQDITLDLLTNAAATGVTFSGGTTTANAGGRLDVQTVTSTRAIAVTTITAGTLQLVNISAPSGTITVTSTTINGGSATSAGYAIYISSACNLNVNATTMNGGTASNTQAFNSTSSSGTITINSTNIVNSSTSGAIILAPSAGTISITGILTNTYNQGLISVSGAGTVNITATGGMTSSTGTATAIAVTGTVSVNFTGSITASTVSASVGFSAGGTGTVTITGNVTGGFVGAYGVNNGSTGTVVINGTAAAHPTIGGIAVRNNSTGTVTVTRAKGCDYGSGSVGAVFGYAFTDGNSQTAINQIYELEFGARGAQPVGCTVYRMVPATTNKAIFCTGSAAVVSGFKTLIDYAASGDFPSGSNVRYGVSYNNGSLIGSLVLPSAQNVSYGTVFDSGVTGTAIITQSGLSQTVQNLLLALT